MGILKSLKQRWIQFQVRNKPKIFGIGYNKTGTTSLTAEMKRRGFVVGHQKTAVKLIDRWAERNFEPIVSYCKTAEFFQDIPFSLPDTFIHMDRAFPGSKFILTVRDDAEQWYQSVVAFNSKKFGLAGRLPIKEDLQNASYIEKGWMWKANRMIHDTPEDDLYEKHALIRGYESHVQDVIRYFEGREKDFIMINVSKSEDYERFCTFLNLSKDAERFPWAKKTSEL
jgi:hypothetical protein